MYDMTKMNLIAKTAIDQMPPASRFNQEDALTIDKYTEALLSWGPELVQRFYDTVFEHEATKKVFRHDERHMREKSLTDFWVKTLTEPIDLDYFGWMAMVGLIHVVRGVDNPMMLAMSSFLTDFISEKVSQEPSIAPEEALKVVNAFRRFSSTISAIITYGYDSARVNALFDIIGMEESLLQRLTKQTVEKHLNQAGYTMTEKRNFVAR